MTDGTRFVEGGLMEVSVQLIPEEQKSVLVRMMELYLYDFSEFSGDELNEYGYYGYAHIDDYWNERERSPFFIRAGGKLAGFALVRHCSEYRDLQSPHNMAEFFVMRKYRRAGVGRAAAQRVFDRFPGGWEISVWENNLPARAFWERVVSSYTRGDYEPFAVGNITGFSFQTANSNHLTSSV